MDGYKSVITRGELASGFWWKRAKVFACLLRWWARFAFGVVLRKIRFDGAGCVATNDSGDFYAAQRRKTSEPLVPPKPKEFDRA